MDIHDIAKNLFPSDKGTLTIHFSQGGRSYFKETGIYRRSLTLISDLLRKNHSIDLNGTNQEGVIKNNDKIVFHYKIEDNYNQGSLGDSFEIDVTDCDGKAVKYSFVKMMLD